MFRPGELPIVLLSMLAEKPRGGYELLRALSDRFGPSYRPSPGGVYPALGALDAERLVVAIETRGARTYKVTAAGRRLLSANSELLAEIERRVDIETQQEPSVQSALDRLLGSVTNATGLVEPSAIERILDRAAHSISNLQGQT